MEYVLVLMVIKDQSITYLGICEEKELLDRLVQTGEGVLRALGGDRLGVGEEGLVDAAGVGHIFSLRVGPVHLNGFVVYSSSPVTK